MPLKVSYTYFERRTDSQITTPHLPPFQGGFLKGVKNMFKVNDLFQYRYFITTKANDEKGHYTVPATALGWSKTAVSITYENLIKVHISNLDKNSKSSSVEQVKRNHMTALHSFMRHLKKHETTAVGAELGSEFDQTLHSYIASLELSQRSKRDRRSLLYAWRDTFKSIGGESVNTKRERSSAAVAQVHQTAFERTLKNALKAAKLTPKRAAIIAGVSTSALGRWSRGALPNIRSAETLAKLDKSLGLPNGTLLKALHETIGYGLELKEKDSYKKRLVANIQDEYILKEREITESFANEWANLLKFKTSPITNKLKRGKNRKWNLLPQTQSTVKPSFASSVGPLVCPTACLIWRHISSFVGYLRLPHTSGGFGLSDQNSQTLSWFAVPDALIGYFNFMTQRAGGLRHGGQARFCTFVISLFHSDHGYLTQCPEFIEKLPDEYKTESWSEMCESARLTAIELKADCHDKSRDPSGPIAPLLALENPLSPIFDAMRKLRTQGDFAPKNSKSEAVARRDELLIGLLVFNPLRANNVITLTYKEDGTGEIFKDATGGWTIKLNAGRLKNRKRQAGKAYVVKLPEWLSRLIDDYVNSYRKTLLGKNISDYFFLSNSGKRFDSMGVQFNKITRSLIPGCSGFGPHAMRHLVATNWLNKNPNDFLTVAELLNDTIEVVMKNYAHLKKDTAFSRYNNYLQSIDTFERFYGECVF